MTRLVYLGPDLVDPEDAFEPLRGRRPAPEMLAFSEADAGQIARLRAGVVVVDGRGAADSAAAVINKIAGDVDATFLVVLSPADVATFDWSCGASDFVMGDSSTEEFEGRVARLINPVTAESGEEIKRGPVTINRDRFEVRVRGDLVDLTFKEFELLEYLASRPGKVCSRSVLLQEVWGYDFFGGTRTVDVHVRRLRAKLTHDSHLIETVRNVGYRFAAA